MLVHSGIANPQPAKTVGAPKRPHFAIPQRFHRVVFHPAVIVEREDDHDLRAIGFLQTAAQRVDDEGARQVLIFDVQELTRRRDEIEVQRFHFATGDQGVSTRDGNGHVGEIRRDVFGPRIAAGLRIRDEFSGGSAPAVADDLDESCRRISIHERLHIMGGRISTARVLRAVLRGVPASAREVHPSSEGELSIDADDLLVMACARRMDIVGLETDATVFEGVLSLHKLRIANVGEEYRKVPRKN